MLLVPWNAEMEGSFGSPPTKSLTEFIFWALGPAPPRNELRLLIPGMLRWAYSY